MQRLDAKFVLLLLLMMLPGGVFAQEWLPDRDSKEGPGILLGDSLVFHPGIGVEGGYDTNSLRRSAKEGVEAAGRLRINAVFDLATRARKRKVQDEGVLDASPPKINFRLGTAVYYDFYFSKDKIVDKQDNLGFDVHLNLQALPERPFSVIADALYVRSQDPFESSGERWSWHAIRPGLGFLLNPGGGTLKFELGYRLGLRLYEDAFLADRNNKMEHEVRFITSWKIFPKTSIIQKNTFTPIVYMSDENKNAASRVNGDSMPVRSQIGIQGLFTDRFGLTLFVGYGASFYKQGDDFDSVIANGEVMFFITQFSSLCLGGQRDFVDSFYGNFFEKNGGYLRYEQMIGGFFLASLKGDVYYRRYATFDITDDNYDTGDKRGEVWLGVTLLLEARANNWLSFHISTKYQGSLTDYAFLTTSGETLPTSFHRFEVFAGVRAYY